MKCKTNAQWWGLGVEDGWSILDVKIIKKKKKKKKMNVALRSGEERASLMKENWLFKIKVVFLWTK